MIAVVFLLAFTGQAFAAGPTAIGVDSDGVAYVGFANGGQIQRIEGAGGGALPSWGTPGNAPGQLGGVVGIDVAPGPSGDVYILDTNRRIQRFTRSGSYVSGTQLGACGAGISPDPLTRGGIDVSNDRIYVSHPCANTVTVMNLSYGVVNSTSLTGGKGVSAQLYESAPSNTRYLYVAQPGLNRVTVLDRISLAVIGAKGQSGPATDVFIDAFGVLQVTETAEDKLHMFGSDDSEFRWLGSTGSSVGRLNDPMAFDVFEQYSDFAGNVFFADYGNRRVQRMNSYGFTFWAVPADDAGAGPTAPVNTTPPAITGTPAEGSTVSCTNGSWSNSPSSYTYRWNRNGAPIGGATSQTYTVQNADVGQQLTCTVTASNGAGSGQATSSAVTPSAAATAPVNTTRPAITGTAQPGGTLTCNQGNWTGNPTSYTYAWQRDGVQIATGSTYTVTGADVAHAITCTETATNANGSATALSDPVTPTNPAGPVRTGVSINGAAQFTTSGAVTLTIHEPAGATSILISNDGGFSNPTTRPVVGSDLYSWNLSSAGAERLPKTVYVRFVGGGYDEDKTFTDDIILDTRPPALTSASVSGSGSGNASAAAAGSVLRVAAKDAASGLGQLQYSATKGGKKIKTLKKFRRSVKVRSASAARWVRVFDRAGNAGKWTRVKRR